MALSTLANTPKILGSGIGLLIVHATRRQPRAYVVDQKPNTNRDGTGTFGVVAPAARRRSPRSSAPCLRSLAAMSALPPKADMAERDQDVRFVPKADMKPLIRSTRLRVAGAAQALLARAL